MALREARRLAQRGRGTRQRIYVTGCLGDLERQRGNFAAARKLFEQTLIWAKEAFISGRVGNAHLGPAKLAFGANKAEEAQVFMEQADSHYRDIDPGHLWGQVQVGLLRGRLLRATGRQQWRDVLEETHHGASGVEYRRDVPVLREALEHHSRPADPPMFL